MGTFAKIYESTAIYTISSALCAPLLPATRAYGMWKETPINIAWRCSYGLDYYQIVHALTPFLALPNQE